MRKNLNEFCKENYGSNGQLLAKNAKPSEVAIVPQRQPGAGARGLASHPPGGDSGGGRRHESARMSPKRREGRTHPRRVIGILR